MISLEVRGCCHDSNVAADIAESCVSKSKPDRVYGGLLYGTDSIVVVITRCAAIVCYADTGVCGYFDYKGLVDQRVLRIAKLRFIVAIMKVSSCS